MSQIYWFGYFIICLVVIGFVNSIFLKGDKKKRVEKDSVSNVEVTEEGQKEVKLGKILFVLLFGMFIAILNQTVINVLLPLIMNNLNISTSTAQWLSTGFMLTNGILIPISAFLMQRFGYRKLFIFAMSSFTIGSIICAISGNLTLLLIGRIIQAIGAGILMPLGTNVFMSAFPKDKVGSAMGTMGIAMILAPAIGPTLSGWLAEHYHWNLMFYGMSILGIISVLFGIAWFHPRSKITYPKLDIQGVIYSTIGFGSLLYGFSEAGTDGWTDPIVLSTLIVGVIFIGLFTVRQLTEKNPLLDLRVFKFNIYTFTLIINSIITMALYGGMLLLPIYLQNIRGFTPLQSGLLLLPGALIMGFMGPIAGKIFDKYGIRVLAVIGLGITTYATFQYTKLTGQTPFKSILGIYMLRSFGMSLLMMTITTAGLNQLPPNLMPHGTALTNTIRQVAGSIGTALLVTIMTNQTHVHLANFTNVLSQNNQLLSTNVHNLGQTGFLLLYSKAANISMIQGINDAFLIATIFAGIAFVLAFFLKTPKVSSQETIN